MHNSWLRLSASIIILVSLTLPVHAEDVPKDIARTVDVTAGKPSIAPSRYKNHQGHKYERQVTTLQTGETKYGLQYRACIDECHGDKVGIVEGYLGLCKPGNENFYGGGFLKFFLNGQDVGEWRLADRRIVEKGTRGICRYIWETPMATVRARFLLLPGTKYLCCEISWEAKEPVTAAEVRLLCYPSFFTAARGRKGERHVVSAAKDVMEGKPFAIDPTQEAWLFYCDRIFDVARGEGAGPCAALFVPEDVAAGSIGIGHYGVSTTLKVKPGSRSVRLAFREFTALSNEEALAGLKTDAGNLLPTLAALDFAPSGLQTDNVSKLRAEFAELFKIAGKAADPCRGRIETLLAKLPTDDRAAGGLKNWEAEADMLSATPELLRLRWELRIRALLARGDRMY